MSVSKRFCTAFFVLHCSGWACSASDILCLWLILFTYLS